MTKAEKDVIVYLIYESGADCCQKCIHLNRESCCLYNPKTGYCDNIEADDCDDNYCIDGMVKYFEQQ